ncbi:hypothetical protein [Flagellimonas sp.]|uniref:hypothetical protein n=1 Tax=Flagellimonas sp. TaxID=2058762 RepID=UPI003B51285D
MGVETGSHYFYPELADGYYKSSPNPKIGQTQKAAYSFSLVNTTTQPDRQDGGRPNV